MKRKLFILCILLGLVGAHATAYDFKVDGIYYNIISASESTCEVTKGDVAYSGNIKIPATVNHENQTFSVTKIGDYTFSSSYSLTSITIPKSVVSIGTDAFNGTNNLTSLIVEEGNTVYDSRNNCNAIIEKETNKLILGCKSTIIPNSVTSIKSYAFNDLDLTNITIPNSITNIEHSAFYSSTSELTNIVVEEGNTVYDSRGNCNAIIEKETNKLVLGCKNTIIPNSVTSIGAEAFSRCYSLQEITIPNSVNSIEYSAFYYCGLTDINIPSSVTTIGSYAFCNCSSLTNVTIPNSVTTIGTSAFDNCSSLTSITIPNSVTTIEVNTFYDCSSLTNVTIPNSVTTIGSYAFCYYSSLTNVTIPNSVTSIGAGAFRNCSSLTNVTIPNSVTSIGAVAFSGCDNIPTEDNIRYVGTWAVEVTNKAQTTYTLRDNTTGVIPYLFGNCTNLQSINIPNSVTKIGSEAFSGCN